MRIIIEIKETAKLERIANFGKVLELHAGVSFPDVIADIHKEGEHHGIKDFFDGFISKAELFSRTQDYENIYL